MPPPRCTPRLLVTGGIGNLGGHVLSRLRGRDVVIRTLSRRPQLTVPAVEHVVADLTRRGTLDSALADVDVIVHCASAKKGDLEAARNLLDAASRLPHAPHFLLISIVGAADVRFGYFQAKLDVEAAVESSGLPWTIQRSTQFFDFILDGTQRLSRMPVIPVPKQFRCQPIDVREVADKLVELTLGEPRGRAPDIGGPERTTWAAMVRDYVGMTGRRRSVLEVPMPGMRSVRAGALLVGPDAEPDGPYGQTTWRAFLQTRLHGEAVRR